MSETTDPDAARPVTTHAEYVAERDRLRDVRLREARGALRTCVAAWRDVNQALTDKLAVVAPGADEDLSTFRDLLLKEEIFAALRPSDGVLDLLLSVLLDWGLGKVFKKVGDAIVKGMTQLIRHKYESSKLATELGEMLWSVEDGKRAAGDQGLARWKTFLTAEKELQDKFLAGVQGKVKAKVAGALDALGAAAVVYDARPRGGGSPVAGWTTPLAQLKMAIPTLQQAAVAPWNRLLGQIDSYEMVQPGPWYGGSRLTSFLASSPEAGPVGPEQWRADLDDLAFRIAFLRSITAALSVVMESELRGLARTLGEMTSEQRDSLNYFLRGLYLAAFLANDPSVQAIDAWAGTNLLEGRQQPLTLTDGHLWSGDGRLAGSIRDGRYELAPGRDVTWIAISDRYFDYRPLLTRMPKAALARLASMLYFIENLRPATTPSSRILTLRDPDDLPTGGARIADGGDPIGANELALTQGAGMTVDQVAFRFWSRTHAPPPHLPGEVPSPADYAQEPWPRGPLPAADHVLDPAPLDAFNMVLEPVDPIVAERARAAFLTAPFTFTDGSGQRTAYHAELVALLDVSAYRRLVEFLCFVALSQYLSRGANSRRLLEEAARALARPQP